MPRVVTALAVAVEEIRAIAEDVGAIVVLVALDVGGTRRTTVQWIRDAIRSAVAHGFGKCAIDQEELSVVVTAREIPIRRAAEAAVAQHKLLVRIVASIVPDGGGSTRVHLRDGRVLHVTPAARADEIHRADDVQPRMIVAAAFAPNGLVCFGHTGGDDGFVL